jgi:hypothetical protein
MAGLFGGGILGSRPGLPFPQEGRDVDFAGRPIGNPNAMPSLQTGVGQIKPGFDWAGKAGQLGARLLSAGGSPLGAQLMQQRQQGIDNDRADARQRWLMEREERHANKPQVVNTGDGGIAMVGPDGNVQMVREPDAPQPGEQERLIDLYSKLPEGDPRKPLIERAIRGYQYTAPVMQAKQENAVELADHRLGNSLSLKQAPTYAQTHPKVGGGGQYEYRMGPNGTLQRRRVR